ncbi:MAG: diguanylate cyclase response regulator, partial [Sulfurovum sp.]
MKQVLPRILLVEDEPEVRFELKRFLQRYGKEVMTANNGEEGLLLYGAHMPDIVITDIKMPKMSGIEMAKEIKLQAPEQAIIFTTAHSDNDYFLEAIELQVDGYIPKPVDLGALKRKIQHVAQRIEANKQKKFYENILNDIAQMQGVMLAVYDVDGSALFYNKKLLNFLGVRSLEEFENKYVS